MRNRAVIRRNCKVDDRVDESDSCKHRQDVRTNFCRHEMYKKIIRLRGGAPFERSIPMETDQDLVKPSKLAQRYRFTSKTIMYPGVPFNTS